MSEMQDYTARRMAEAAERLRVAHHPVFRLKKADFKRVLLRTLADEARLGGWTLHRNDGATTSPMRSRHYKIYPY